MDNLRRKFTDRLSSIHKPRIISGKNVKIHPPQIFGQDVHIVDQTITIGGSVIIRPSILKISAPGYDIPIHSNVSPNILEADGLVHVVISELSVFSASYFSPVEILDNIFESLPPTLIYGMTYGDRYWSEIPRSDTIEEEEKRSIKSASGQNVQFPPKSKRKRNDSTPTISFWDLIFVVLKPPIALAETENLFFPYHLAPYQRTGISFLMANESALLADDMGTGKTVMTTVALRVLIQQGQARCAVILSPPSVLMVWNSHLDDWAPDLVKVRVRGSQSQRAALWLDRAHVYITTYDTLKSDIENGILAPHQFEQFDIVVIDEAHHVKNAQSGRARALRKLSARQRWALTGTPVQNKIDDLVSIFDFLRPGYLNHFKPYNLNSNRIMDAIRPYFLRRRKQEVMPELPPKQRQDFWLEMDEEQKRAYEEMEQQAINELTAPDSKITKVHIFALYMKLKQICNFAPGKGASPKMDKLKEQIEEIVESGNKVIVFSQYIEEGINKLTQALAPYGIAKIVGGQTDNTRYAEIERFKRNKDFPVLIVSVKSGGEGLNLTEASYVIHFDHWWNPAVMWQAEDRVHRKGQLRGVNVYSYLDVWNNRRTY